MSDFLKRFLFLVVVFLAAFFAVGKFRSYWANGKFGSDGPRRPESYTLPEKPVLNLEDVDVLAAIDAANARLVDAIAPSVVSIDTSGFKIQRGVDRYGWTRQYRAKTAGIGSGVIVSKEGHIVTNYHVIANQEEIKVTLHNQRSYPAKLIGTDPTLDIAVLRIDDKGPFEPLSFGDSDRVSVGQQVFAAGNPFGLRATVTRGIISARERQLSDTQLDAFQVDAAINPGNSGGPLVNIRGEIIAINTAIFSPDHENPGFQGVGFSIPSNLVKESFIAILDRGVPARGYLGIEMREVNAETRYLSGFTGNKGIEVTNVLPDSPAERAKLEPGDIILSYNGDELDSFAAFRTRIQRTPIDKDVPLKVWRKGQELDLVAKITEISSTPAGKQVAPEDILHMSGLTVGSLTDEQRTRGLHGVEITAVQQNSIASQIGLAQGDIIVGVNNARVESLEQLLTSFGQAAHVRRLVIYRGRQLLYADLPSLRRK